MAAQIPHPFDPLTQLEIETAIAVVKQAHGDQLFFNVVSLHEPRKAEMTAWLADPNNAPRPRRVADVVVIAKGGNVYDGLIDLAESKISKWEHAEGQQPIVSRPSHCRMPAPLTQTHPPRSPWRSSSWSSTLSARTPR